MAKRQATEAQKKAAQEKRQAFANLCNDIAEMSDEQRAVLSSKMAVLTTCEGHTLSVKNTMLIAMQMDSATVVGGFHQWRGMGRTVKRGEHGLMIWIPRTEGKNGKGGEAEAEDSKDHPSFFAGYVFDISQTEPMTTGPAASIEESEVD